MAKENKQNQHYVPKFLLRNFVDTDGRVFCFNKKTDGITKPPPKYAGSREGFNEFIIEGESVSFEERFQKIETRAAPVFRKIVEQNSLALVTQAERQAAADFIAIQCFRTNAFREGLAQNHQANMGSLMEQLWESNFATARLITNRKWLSRLAFFHHQHIAARLVGNAFQ